LFFRYFLSRLAFAASASRMRTKSDQSWAHWTSLRSPLEDGMTNWLEPLMTFVNCRCVAFLFVPRCRYIGRSPLTLLRDRSADAIGLVKMVAANRLCGMNS